MTGKCAEKKWLTPYEQEALFAASDILINAFLDEYYSVFWGKPETIFSTRLGEHLPRQYFSHYTPQFYKEFGVCVITVAWKLAQPKPIPPASVAEQLAAWAILQQAKALLNREGRDKGTDETQQLLDSFSNEYLPDTSFLLLFDPACDGIQVNPLAPATQHNASSFENWFRLFPGRMQSVHPYAGGSPQVGRAYKTYLTRRERETLATTIDVFIDEIFDSMARRDKSKSEVFALTALQWHLPLHHQSEYTPLFQKQFIVCILTAALKLALPRPMLLSSIAEELAAWAIMTTAKQQIELDYDIEGKEGGEQAATYAFEDLIEVFFEDEDFLLLFDAKNDGIDASPVGQWLHMTSLAFKDWLKPFTDEAGRIAHPYVCKA